MTTTPLYGCSEDRAETRSRRAHAAKPRRTGRWARRLGVSVTIVLAMCGASMTTAPAASAQIFVTGRLVHTSGSCILKGGSIYSMAPGGYEAPMYVRMLTSVHGGSTTSTGWTRVATSDALGTVTGVMGAMPPQGYYYAQYLQFAHWDPVQGWQYVGEWVPKGSTYWCRG